MKPHNYTDQTLIVQMDEKADSFRQRLDSTEARLRRSEQHHTSDIEDALLRLEEERKR